ncbi:hypothetical protein GCM10007301_48910 [Azorhizobium oxalatiphilum]|uniref:DUF2155 domain-containing protein n=1 Tax=Azorhizobium oxalatiphilum TaxID=980631 RepID=A0A917CDW2_9HYPH|nr:DUF2155 domain-containing protein [Azorhizobium oxalatiphilum]GGF82998.1 hypothetical protein GCM10007301_48910 [Azorhizobium oxalatiphilum]
MRFSPLVSAMLASVVVAAALTGGGGLTLAQAIDSQPLLPPAGVGQPDYPGYPSNNRAQPQQRAQPQPQYQQQPAQQSPYQGLFEPQYQGGRAGQSGQGQVQSQPLPQPQYVPQSQQQVQPPAQPSAPPAGTYRGIYEGQPQQAQPSQQRQPAGRPATPPPAAAAPAQPGAPAQPPVNNDVLVVPPPAEKIVNPTAVYAGLDKITGRITSFEVGMGETVQFGALQVTPRACYTRPPTEPQNTTSFAEVNEITLKGEAKRIFTGWMFASSPGLHGVEHPIYDVWLTDCKATAPVTVKPGAQR